MCFLFSRQLLCEVFLILRRDEPDMIKMYIGVYVNYRLMSDFSET